MTILGIETSCDETGAAVVERDDSFSLQVKSNSISSSLSLHAQTGGIIPEIAAREQVRFMLPVLEEALKKGVGFPLKEARSDEIPPIDAIAVTYGPGLIGSLLVGVETAKTLALLWNKPLIPVNHLYGHLYANLIQTNTHHPGEITFPALSLIVSGGHTDLVLMQSHKEMTVIGGTRDDAAGEAFDKIGRLLSLSYPAGPTISRLARKGDTKAFPLPRPMLGSQDFDFSFSGLKTAVLSLIKKEGWDFSNATFKDTNTQLLADLCASVEMAIVDVLVKKTIKAGKEYRVKTLLLGGGVAANDALKESFQTRLTKELPDVTFMVPPKQLCTDNAAMIAAAAFFAKIKAIDTVTADPELYF